MSYLVFARKWRPLSFDDVVGQEHITSTLKRAIEKKRVAHAFIFTGTRGVGKTTTARILARALNCEKGPTPAPCGECESCKNIIRGSSFDVIEIDGASNNGVDDIRELRENVSYTSMGGKYRIFVIDEVHMLTKGAFNALLKTLEEPPEFVIFIFATTEPQKIPETIQSRCQRYDFRRISTEQIAAQLEKICTAEQIPFEKSALSLIARRGDGSMRDALSILDQVFSFCKDRITERDVRDVLGLVELEIYCAIMEAAVEKKPAQALQIVEQVLERGFDLSEFIVGYQEYVRSLLFSRMPGMADVSKTEGQQEQQSAYADIASHFSEGDLLRIAEILRKAESDIRWSAFPRFVVETALVKIVYLDSTVTVQQILSSFKNDGSASSIPEKAPEYSLGNKKKSDVQQLTKEAPVSYAASLVASIPLKEDICSFDESSAQTGITDIIRQWPVFVEKIIEEKQNLGTFVSMGYIASHNDHSIDLRFGKQFGFQFAEVTRKNNRAFLEKKLETVMGRPVELHITREKEDGLGQKPEIKVAHDTGMRHPSLEDDMANEPVIKSVIELFDGQVI